MESPFLAEFAFDCKYSHFSVCGIQFSNFSILYTEFGIALELRNEQSSFPDFDGFLELSTFFFSSSERKFSIQTIEQDACRISA